MANNTKGDIREAVLDAIESSLGAQLRAVRKLRHPKPEKRREPRRSQIDLVYDILRSHGTPLHVSEIIAKARVGFGVELQRESIVSALTKKVAAGDRFVRTDKNTFGLLEW
jgi:hypothetical protein